VGVGYIKITLPHTHIVYYPLKDRYTVFMLLQYVSPLAFCGKQKGKRRTVYAIAVSTVCQKIHK
jgi:hypothetical protein